MPRNRTLPAGHHRQMTTTRRGFTLIEVVVVAVVIGVLASVAVPRYAASKDKAYVATMMADLHSAAVYEEQYATENHGQYFSGTATEATSVEGFRASKDVTVKLVATSIMGSQISEWTATARHDKSSESCAIRVGSIVCTTGDELTTGVILHN